MNNFWKSLEKPFFILAPMEDVTDTVFRRVIMYAGRPDVFFTEFTNCEGAQSVGQARIIHRLKFDESERPIVAQIWGITPEDYYKTTKMIVELGFDGVDINMGCPVKNVIRQGACSALIKNPNLAKEIILAVKEATKSTIPMSIKTRIGFSNISTKQWCRFLLNECKPDALTIHGRTAKEESKVECHWDEIGKVVQIRDEMKSECLIIGNGDILSIQAGKDKVAEFGLDGIMIGRGIFQNPWLFDENVILEKKTQADRIKLLQFHLDLWEKTWQDSSLETQKPFQVLKKYFKIYISGFEGAATLRAELMETNSTEEAKNVLEVLTR